MLIKYKLGDLAKDLGLSNKQLIETMGKVGADKKHTSVLTEQELNYAFSAVTAAHQSADLKAYYPEEKKAAPSQPQPGRQPAAQPQKSQPQQPARQQPQKPKQPQQPVSKERINRVVDTRSTEINLDKYNVKYDNIADSSRESGSGKRKNPNAFGNKQKLNKRSQQRGRQQYQKRESEAEKLQRIQLEKARKAQLKITIPDEISVGELANRLKLNANVVIKKLMGYGVMASISELIDFDTAALVADELGAKVERKVEVAIEERLFTDDTVAEDPSQLKPRPPVVVVMGHVDHGKTSLLDYIRNTRVTEGEAGGITQHIGAYQVPVGDGCITFLDTPGHEAFTAMRARGAMFTDIAILVVAADDGIMPQTVESINHAKAAGVQIIVAINKMDKPEANAERVMEGLTKYELVPEEWGGDVICVPVSAKTGMGVDKLLEAVLLISEVQEYKANPNRLAKGAVIEARLDKGRGPIATLLVQQGTLHQGDAIIAGTSVGRVRAMLNDKGERITEAGPSVPVEITGLESVPAAGDDFNAVEDERLAHELVEQRIAAKKEEQYKEYTKVTLDTLFSTMEQGNIKELPLIVKADVQGTCEAVKQSLERISTDEVRVKVIHSAVGGINSGDVKLAEASGAIVVGFNVRPDPTAREEAELAGVELRMYRVIYDAIEDIQAAMKGMLPPKTREVEQGRIAVREVYKISSVGTVAGSYVESGFVTRQSSIRVVRDGIVVAEDRIDSLRRFKDDVKEVRQGFECGIGLEKFSDVKVGDIFEAYTIEEYRD